MKQNVNFSLKNGKMLEQSILMIQELLLRIQTIWMIFIKTLKIIIQIKKRKILIIFDDIIADMLSIKKLNLKVTELFIRGRKLNISFVFITQFYFAVPIDIRLNCMHHFIVKIPNKRELKQIASQNSSDIDFLDFINFIKNCKIIYIYIF